MDKYSLLIILNAPFIIFGVLRAFVSYQKGLVKVPGLIGRLLFWLIIFLGLFFAEEIYNFLVLRRLTDSSPLSIADVVEMTGITFCIAMIMRLYAKQDSTELELTKLQQALSILLSEKTPTKPKRSKTSNK